MVIFTIGNAHDECHVVKDMLTFREQLFSFYWSVYYVDFYIINLFRLEVAVILETREKTKIPLKSTHIFYLFLYVCLFWGLGLLGFLGFF